MKIRTFQSTVILAILLFSASISEAQETGGKLSVSMSIGYASLRMDDYNTVIGYYANSVNQQTGQPITLDRIDGDLTIFGDLRYRITPRGGFALSLGYLQDRIENHNGGAMSIEGVNGTFQLDTDYNLRSKPVMGSLIVYLPNRVINPYVGLGIGFYPVESDFKSSSITFFPVDPQYSSESIDEDIMEGQGLGYQFFIGGEYYITKRIALGADALYRLIKIDELRYEDGNIVKRPNASLNFTDENMIFDLGGFTFGGGLRFHF